MASLDPSEMVEADTVSEEDLLSLDPDFGDTEEHQTRRFARIWGDEPAICGFVRNLGRDCWATTNALVAYGFPVEDAWILSLHVWGER